MVSLDQSAVFDTPTFRTPRLPFAVVMVALLALAVFATGFALRGFSDNGVRFGTQLVWRFNSLVFFVALVAGPLGRLVPGLRPLADQGRPLLQGFCAAMAVYVAAILAPNLFAVSDGVRPGGITAGMTFFVAFTGSVTLVLAAAVNRSLCRQVGRKACHAMLGIAAIYFWLCYSLIGLAHISGPHRPDSYYEISVILMIAALLVRFAEHFRRHWSRAAAA
jgi:hypothetical protein